MANFGRMMRQPACRCGDRISQIAGCDVDTAIQEKVDLGLFAVMLTNTAPRRYLPA